jgi:formylglycine-generating enzyme required for sulfatase activity
LAGGGRLILSPGFAQSGKHPAVCVSWADAQGYAAWLSFRSGRRFRLLTEAEWEYAARAGSVTRYWWGESITPDQANYKIGDGAAGRRTVPVDCFDPNPWGLYQMHGNVWEWVEDCWSQNYAGASKNGEPRAGEWDCKRVVRGGGMAQPATWSAVSASSCSTSRFSPERRRLSSCRNAHVAQPAKTFYRSAFVDPLWCLRAGAEVAPVGGPVVPYVCTST